MTSIDEVWLTPKFTSSLGPIVRISPYEIHIRDPEFLDEVYPSYAARRTEKYEWAMRMFGVKTGLGVTKDHELHRIRRAPFAHYFSKGSLQKLEPSIQSVVDRLTSRLEELKGSGKSVDLKHLFACFTVEVIGQYAFNTTYDFLADPNFSPWWHDLLMIASQNGHMLKQFGFMLPMMKAMPLWMVKIVNPQMFALLELQQSSRKQVLEAKANIADGKVPSDRTTIFYEVLMNDNVRPQEKDTDHLQDEAQTIIGAGTMTTAHILAITAFHVIDNPAVLEKLQAELTTITAKEVTPKWHQLEQLSYLSAIITEGLRIGYGVSHPFVVPFTFSGAL